MAVACVDAPRDAPANEGMPCGACRQVMQEFIAPDVPIFVKGFGETNLENLLPHAFTIRKKN